MWVVVGGTPGLPQYALLLWRDELRKMGERQQRCCRAMIRSHAKQGQAIVQRVIAVDPPRGLRICGVWLPP